MRIALAVDTSNQPVSDVNANEASIGQVPRSLATAGSGANPIRLLAETAQRP